MVSSMDDHQLFSREFVVDHFNGMRITRPDPHSIRAYDFDFRKENECWRYLNSSDDLLAFNEQIKTTIESGGEYRIIAAESGEIVKTNVVYR
jgi:hypothetical protein